jgi:hypothetical protein
VSTLLAEKFTKGVSDTSCQLWQTMSACFHDIKHFIENQSIGVQSASRQNMKTFCLQDILSTFTTGVNEIGGAS